MEHAIGAEPRYETGEPTALEHTDPLRQQGFTHLVAFDCRPGEDHTIERPPDYDRFRAGFASLVGVSDDPRTEAAPPVRRAEGRSFTALPVLHLRDVRDYRIHSTAENRLVLGGSPFNIKLESLRLGDFSEREIRALLTQHTDATGQAFTEEAQALIRTRTAGQSWLVNALCRAVSRAARRASSSIASSRVISSRSRVRSCLSAARVEEELKATRGLMDERFDDSIAQSNKQLVKVPIDLLSTGGNPISR